MTELDRYKLAVSVASEVDWVRVSNVMDHLNWCWFTSTKPPHPSDLLQAAIDKLVSCMDYLISNPDQSEVSMASGGIFTNAHRKDSTYMLRVAFEVSQADNYP